MRGPFTRALRTLLLCTLPLVLPAASSADDTKPRVEKRAKRAKAERRARAGQKRARTRVGRPAREPRAPASSAESSVESSAAASAKAAAEAASVDAEIVKEGETSVKVMKFSGLGIEGRLKSPQLLYFDQRVRTEFAHPTLPHRSFLPELARTTSREPVR